MSHEAQQVNQLLNVIERVRQIHQPAGEYVHRCQVCHVAWPCNTARVIHGVGE